MERHKILLEATQKGDLSSVKKLLSSDPSLLFCDNAQNKQNVLHIASFEGHIEIVNFLLSHIESKLSEEKSLSDSNPLRKLINAQDIAGWTPLHCSCAQNYLEISLKLLEKGANPTLFTDSLSYPIHYLAKQNLYPKGDAKIDLKKIEGYRSVSVDENNNGKTKSLKRSLKSFPKQVMEISKLSKMSEQGGLPGAILDKMIEKGCDINCQNSSGETPLLLACLHGHKETAVLLLSRGAYAFSVNKKGESCYEYAARRENNKELCDLLNAFSNLLSIYVPDEIYEEIFLYLEDEDIYNVSLVSRRFNKICNSNKIWKKLCQDFYSRDAISGLYGETKGTPCVDDYKTEYKRLYAEERRFGWLPRNWKKEWDNPPIIAIDENDPYAATYDHLFKMITIGDSGVGKSSLILRAVDNTFDESIKFTIGADFKIKTVGVNNKNVKLQIWDTGGQERFRSINGGYYRAAKGILVAFDLTDRSTFNNVLQWMKEVDRYCYIIDDDDEDKVCKLLVGCKSDLEGERRVTYEEAKHLADSLNIRYMETSSKDNINVELAFAVVAHAILRRTKPKGPTPDRKNQKCSIM